MKAVTAATAVVANAHISVPQALEKIVKAVGSNLARCLHSGIEEWSLRVGKNLTSGRHELADIAGYKFGHEDAELLT